MRKSGSEILMEKCKEAGELRKLLEGKTVLYIASKNSDYIRVQQEICMVKENSAGYTLVVSDKKSYLKRILYVFYKLITLSTNKYDLIFVSFMPQMIVPFFEWKFKHKFLVVDFFISIYDTLVDDRKRIREGSFFSKVLHKLDQRTLRNADYIVCDTKAHGEYFSEEFKIELQKFIVLYLEADTVCYHPMQIERSEEWRDKFLVLYFGSILPLQGVDIILDAIEQLKNYKTIHFIMIGPIDQKYKKVISDTVTYIDWLSQNELAMYISYADLCLAGHFSASIGKANRTIAGKTYIYKAMGKAVVLGDSAANRELFVEKEKENYYVTRGDGRKLADKILQCYGEYKDAGE